MDEIDELIKKYDKNLNSDFRLPSVHSFGEKYSEEGFENIKDVTFREPSKDEYNNPLSFTTQFYFCPIPLRLDSYSGCQHNCLYCFANTSMQKFIGAKDKRIVKNYDNVISTSVKPTSYEAVRKYFDVAFNGKKNTFREQEAIAVECLKRRVPIHFGGMSDPFQPIEKHKQVTLSILKVLKSYNYPLIISTKNKLICDNIYYDILKDYENLKIQVSLIDDRQEIVNMLETGLGTNSVQDRLDIFDKYADKWTAIRIQPVIPMLTEPRLEQLIILAHNHKVNHVVIEGLKLFTSNKLVNNRISEVFKKLTGKPFDLVSYYKSIGATFSGNDLELPTWRKLEYILPVKRRIKALGNMTLGVADNDLRLLGDMPCCCGIKEGEKGFENIIKHNIGFSNFRARDKQVPITYDLIKNEWFPEGNFRSVISVEKLKAKFGEDATYKDANRKVMDMFMEQWNNQGKNSPAQMVHVEYKGVDKDNNAIYGVNIEKIIKTKKQTFLGEFSDEKGK